MTITQIPTKEIKFFVRRARPKAGFERMKQSIQRDGLKVPIQVRKVRGGYELIAGQGRLQAFRELRAEKIPAYVLDVEAKEVVGRFLAENVMRRKLPWLDKAKLIKGEIDRIGHDLTKAEMEDVATRYSITTGHVAKMLKILQNVSPNVSKTLDDLTVQEAAELTSLPAKGQDIVIQSMAEEGLEASQLGAVLSKAKELTQDGGELSKTALKASLKRVGEDLDRQRKQLKLYRLHHALGVANLQMLLSGKSFRNAVKREGINIEKFESGIQS